MAKVEIIRRNKIIKLTSQQKRKPLLGSGNASPVSFFADALDGTLIVATDGLFNYAKDDKISALALKDDFHVLPKKFIELVRLPSGELWDDVGVVLCRQFD